MMCEKINGVTDFGGSHPSTLLLYFAGPMQSWGSRSRFDDRDTHLEPTRSAILGMVCCALGIGREDTGELARLNNGIQRIGVRVDAPGRIARDYQTAQRVIDTVGKGGSTVVSTRHYLADARFLVALESVNHDLLLEIREGMRLPVWSLFMGRKSFPFALPPLLPGAWGEVHNADAEQILLDAPWYTLISDRHGNPAERAPTRVRLLIESADGNNAQADVPVDFAQRRFFLRRFQNAYYPCPKSEVHPCLKP